MKQKRIIFMPAYHMKSPWQWLGKPYNNEYTLRDDSQITYNKTNT